MKTLGSQEEIEFAFHVASDSLDMALNSFDESEIEMIQKNGLLDKTELQETIRLKRQNEMKSSPQNKSPDQHSLNRQK